jgi:hypothetical protein
MVELLHVRERFSIKANHGSPSTGAPVPKLAPSPPEEEQEGMKIFQAFHTNAATGR